jgi:NADPH2:quinone reductase
MKAIVVRQFGAPDVMKLEEVDQPRPGPGQVVVRVRAAGVNPVDTYIRAGAYARTPSLPYTPGSDVGGEVQAVGRGVTRVREGDRVYAHAVAGAYAEAALCEEWQAHPLADGLSFQQGAALGVPYGTAWRALIMRARARPGDTVLVHGASGGVGLAAVQIARAQGMQVIGTAGTVEGVELVRSQGAHHVLNHRDPGYLERVLPLTNGHGVDVVLEMLANVNLDHDLELLALHGRVVVIGNRGRVEIDARKAMARDGAILGMTLFNATRDELREIHSALGAGLENGTLRPVIAREFPLADAALAHVAVMQPGARGKIVLLVGG